MEERLLNKRLTIDEAIEKINKIVNERFEILDKDDNDIEKWTSLPKLMLLDEITKKRIIAFIDYIDTSYIKIDDKCRILISLSGLIENGKIKLYNYENSSLYLLADHYQNSSFIEIDKTINLYKNEEILIKVRNKTLDNDIRLKILDLLENKYLEDNSFNSLDFIDNLDIEDII